MNSSPPPDRPESYRPDGDVHVPLAEDEDTGPLPVTTPAPPADDDWDTGLGPARRADTRSAWAGRFDAPLTVSPRPVHTPRNPKVLLGAVGAVVGVAIVGVLLFWLLRPSPDNPPGAAAQTPEPSTTASPPSATSPTSNAEDETRLRQLLPRGYPPDSCQAVSPPKDALAQVNCDDNVDPDGPPSATYTLASDRAGLDTAFNDAMRTAQRVNCPGNIQSPGPWRRTATPQTVSGTLFCGLREGRPTVVWTDDARLMLGAVQSGPNGPTFPALYTWWSSHS